MIHKVIPCSVSTMPPYQFLPWSGTWSLAYLLDYKDLEDKDHISFISVSPEPCTMSGIQQGFIKCSDDERFKFCHQWN